MTAFADMEAPSPLFRINRWRDKEGNSGVHYWFTCPGCEEAHAIDQRWQFNGDFERPTFSPSFLTWNDPSPDPKPGKFRDGWRCHSFITDGQIAFCSDSTHALAGQTVPMVPFDMDKIMGKDR